MTDILFILDILYILKLVWSDIAYFVSDIYLDIVWLHIFEQISTNTDACCLGINPLLLICSVMSH